MFEALNLGDWDGIRWSNDAGGRVADGKIIAGSSHVGRGKGSLWGLFYMSTDTVHEGSALMT